MRKYKPVRIPIEAYNNLQNKKNIYQEILKQETKKNKRFTFADTLRFISGKKIFVYNDELINFMKNKKNKRNKPGQII